VIDWCEKCEELMQPFLDGVLSEEEVKEAERHLGLCSWCARRYRFEERLRHYVRVAVSEPMSPALKARLSALRTPLL
jgi:anti-sigma factor RsiW